MGDIRVWDYTALDTFLTCRMKYYWFMVRHLRAKSVSPALEFGQCIHTSLDTYYTSLLLKQTDGLEKAVEIFRATYKDREGEEVRTIENGVKLLTHYSEVYKHEPFKVLGRPEIGFVFPIGELLWGGRMDLPVEWTNDELWIMEHKTTTRLQANFFKQFDLNMQITSYILAAEEFMRRPCMGCIVNAIEPWKEVKRVTERTRKPHEHFARDPKMRSAAEKAYFKENVQKIVKDILWCEDRGEFYPNQHACFQYNYDCQYKDLCRFGDSDRIINRDFNVEKWEPYAQIVEGK